MVPAAMFLGALIRTTAVWTRVQPAVVKMERVMVAADALLMAMELRAPLRIALATTLLRQQHAVTARAQEAALRIVGHIPVVTMRVWVHVPVPTIATPRMAIGAMVTPVPI